MVGNRIISTGAILGFVFAVTAGPTAAEIDRTFSPVIFDSDQPDMLVFDGIIDEKARESLEQALVRYPSVDTIALSSPGGYAMRALDMAYMIKDAGLATTVPAGSQCHSACAYMFFAGEPRWVEGELGVHQLASANNDLAAGQALLAAVSKAYRDFKVPSEVIRRMIETPPDTMYVFSSTEVSALGINRRSSAPLEADAGDGPLSTLVLATVNGEMIRLGHIAVARAALPEQYQSLANDVLFGALIEQLIQQTVLAQALTGGVQPASGSGSMSRRAVFQIDNERRAVLAAEKIGEIVSTAASNEAIRAAYSEEYGDAAPTREWNASHILVETEADGFDLILALANGADFAQLAKDRSIGPSAPDGGALGWFSPGMMVKPFEDAVAAMEVGQVAGPVQTQFGWHVVKLLDTRMSGPPAFEAVRDEIVKKLEEDAVDTALELLLGGAVITRADTSGIDPELLVDTTIFD